MSEIADAIEMLGSGYEQVRVKDESNDRKYFIITPRIVKAYSRNPHDLALWDTIKDIAGESGECYLNTEQLAILSGMSTGQVSNSRRYWIKIGFLKGEIRKDHGFSQKVWHLSIPDIWHKNIEWCEKYPKIEDRLTFRKVHRSLHRVKPSPSEGKPSPSETKKKLIKKIKEEEEEGGGQNVFRVYEQEIGPLTPHVANELEEAETVHGANWVCKALRIASVNGKRNWAYTKAILTRWKADGYGTGKTFTRGQSVEDGFAVIDQVLGGANG